MCESERGESSLDLLEIGKEETEREFVMRRVDSMKLL